MKKLRCAHPRIQHQHNNYIVPQAGITFPVNGGQKGLQALNFYRLYIAIIFPLVKTICFVRIPVSSVPHRPVRATFTFSLFTIPYYFPKNPTAGRRKSKSEE